MSIKGGDFLFKKRLLQLLTLLSAFTLFFGVLNLRATIHAASTIDTTQSSKYVDKAYVSNGPDFSHASTIKVHYDLSFPDVTLAEGDTIQIQLPSELKTASEGETFDVMDDTGAVIGTGVVTGGVITVTVNANGAGKTDASMHLDIATKYAGTTDGEQTIKFPSNDESGYDSSVINIIPNPDPISKKGTIQDDGTIKWTILVNRSEVEMSNVKISDTVGDNQSMIEGITVSYGTWNSANSYKRGQQMTSNDYNVAYRDNGFDFKFNNNIDQLMIIDYYTTIDDMELVPSGYKFKNAATMSWGTNGNGGGPITITGSTSSSGSSGSGSGNESSSSSSSSSESSSSSSSSNSSSESSSSSSSSSSESSSSSYSSNSSSESNSSSSSSSSSSEPSSSSSSSSSSSESSSSSSSSNNSSEPGSANSSSNSSSKPESSNSNSNSSSNSVSSNTNSHVSSVQPSTTTSSDSTTSFNSSNTSQQTDNSANNSDTAITQTNKTAERKIINQPTPSQYVSKNAKQLPQTDENKAVTLQVIGSILFVILMGMTLIFKKFAVNTKH